MEVTALGASRMVNPLRAVSRPYRLVALPSAVTCARQLARAQARAWGLDRFAETAEIAELLVTELVTLAVGGVSAPRRYADLYDAHLSQVILRMAVSSVDLLVAVWDSNPAPPVLRDVADHAESGRELRTVGALSREWGHYPCASGKIIWCAIALGSYRVGDTTAPAQHRAHPQDRDSAADVLRRLAVDVHVAGGASVPAESR